VNGRARRVGAWRRSRHGRRTGRGLVSINKEKNQKEEDVKTSQNPSLTCVCSLDRALGYRRSRRRLILTATSSFIVCHSVVRGHGLGMVGLVIHRKR
jgi:hypothetical protein